MSPRNSLPSLLLLAALTVAACSKQDSKATQAMADVTALTDELVTMVQQAEDPKEGVAKAKARLEERKAALSAQMKEVGELKSIELSTEAQNALLSGRADSLAKMGALEEELLPQTFKDPELGDALEELVDAHEALLDGK